MSEDVIAVLGAANELTAAITVEHERILAEVADAKTQIDNYVNLQLSKQPFFRLTKNQALAGTDGQNPDFWLSGAGVTYQKLQLVGKDTAWADRTSEERALLTAMGISDVVKMSADFYIWRMTWDTAEPTHTLYQTVNNSIVLTSGAMMKLESGSLSGFWAEGISDTWQLTGVVHGRSAMGYTNNHPNRDSIEGAALVALPATLAGHHSLVDGWGIFPYIGDSQYD